MTAITILTVLLLAPVVMLTAFFALEVLVGLPGARSRPERRVIVRAVIVIPAHNETLLIGDTVTALLAGRRAFPVLVVADNCSDDTARKAESAGAKVLVRANAELRGKGFALAAARDHLRDDPPAVVIVVDADSRLDGRSLHALALAATESGRPAQAVNLLTPDRRAPPLVQLSNFAFMIKNLVRQRGLQRLAGRAHLTGTGMAFPWRLFEQSDLGGSNIVEDLAAGLELAESGAAPLLIEGAGVWSAAAPAGETLAQRSRWEGGYLKVAIRIAPSLFVRSLRRGDGAGICAALDLAVPPLALLVLLNLALLAIALLARAFGGALWPAFVQLLADTLAFVALSLAWFREGRQFASGATLLRMPLYVLWKLPMYLRFARHGVPKEWVRTR